MMESREELIAEAERRGMWLHTDYQNLTFSPRELREANERGQFKWGAASFRLVDPRTELAALERKAAEAQDDVARFRERMVRA